MAPLTITIPADYVSNSQGDVVVHLPRNVINRGITNFTVRPPRTSPSSR